ncbi:putative uncharacterized protein YGR160W [Phragmites australis]|uniref:putative uncharacterized protein YGR160W n=1 Tax=Phragmites australis TaxID=29695 RepID=UPI002D76D89E|nr:putative uncharacterized protein YGR160W [Phragmites australis]
MATNDKDLASSSSVPAPDDDYINWDLLMVEAEEEDEKEKAIANDKAIACAVHEAELISKAEGMAEAIVSDESITHLLAEEVEIGGNSDTDDGGEDEDEDEEDEEMGADFDTDEEESGDSDMTDEEEEMGGDSDMTEDDRRMRRMRRCATLT